MSRVYSQEFRIEIYKLDRNLPGVSLGIACLEANLPAKYVAPVLKVSRMTLYGWFRGSPMRKKKEVLVHALVRIIQQDKASGRLPAKSVADAKQWLRSVIEDQPEGDSNEKDPSGSLCGDDE
jgi:hypothetical protein